jgi:hypothetical protein
MTMSGITRSRISYLAALAAGVAIGVAAVGTAVASSPGPAVKTVTGHYALAASAFAPDEIGDTNVDYSNQWDPTSLSEGLNSNRCFDAGLVLPDKAKIKSVRFFYTKGSTKMAFEVNRQNLASHTFVQLVSGHTGTTGTPIYTSVSRNVPSGHAVVDPSKYAYSVGVCPGGNTEFSGLIITFTQSAG